MYETDLAGTVTAALSPDGPYAARTGPPPAQVGQLASAVAAALDHLHGQGRVHGDVRPANLQLGQQGQLVLGDGVGPLDPTYAAPERLRDGWGDGRADQYSLACTVFRLLTGRDPYAGADREAVAAAHLGQPVPSVRGVLPYLAPEVDTVIGHAMAKDPRYRYPSCGDFARALSASLAGFSPAPARAPGSARRRWWWVAAAVTAVLAVLAATVVFAGRSPGASDLTKWDDTRYPQEISSVFRAIASDELLNPISPPSPLWTTPISEEQPRVVGGDGTIVLLRVGMYLSGLDAKTGAPSWRARLSDAPTSCVVRENRIGCVAPPSDGSDSTVLIFDTASGTLVTTVKVPNRELTRIVLAGDRFVVTTEDVNPDDTGFAAGYTTEGDEVWTREAQAGMYVVASQGIVVDGAPSGNEVTFVSTDDGREVLRSTRARDERDVSWSVFHGGIAVQNKDWTGADIYDLDGKKLSSVAGWEPAGYQNVYTTASPLPLLTRLTETHYEDEHTLAAANPATGHLLWRISGQELTQQLATADDKLIMKVDDSNEPSDPTAEPSVREVVRVYDCYSGKPVSPPIDMTRKVSVEVYWIESDGSQLLYSYPESGQDVAVAYLIETGEQTWELPLAERPDYVGGSIVAPAGEGSISLFG